MRVMTFNIRYDCKTDGINNFENRKGLIISCIKSENPDIICFQEVLPHVLLWLKEMFSEYYFVGIGREKDLLGEQETIAFKKNKYNLIFLNPYWFSPTPEVPGSKYSIQSDIPRIFTDCLIQDTKTNQLIRVINAHYDHISSEARVFFSKQLINHIQRKIFVNDYKLIICGDFNAEPDSKEILIMKDYDALFDVTDRIDNTLHGFGTLKEKHKIDYIFTNVNTNYSNLRTIKTSDSGVYLSDHFPVCVDLEV